VTCVCLGKCWVFGTCQYLSLLIANSASGKNYRQRNTNVRGFLSITCVCSNALLKIAAAAHMIFIQPCSEAAVRLGPPCYPVCPSCVAALCTGRAQSFSTCASRPGSLSATVLHWHAARGTQKPFLLFTQKQGAAQSLAERLGAAVTPPARVS